MFSLLAFSVSRHLVSCSSVAEPSSSVLWQCIYPPSPLPWRGITVCICKMRSLRPKGMGRRNKGRNYCWRNFLCARLTSSCSLFVSFNPNYVGSNPTLQRRKLRRREEISLALGYTESKRRRMILIKHLLYASTSTTYRLYFTIKHT